MSLRTVNGIEITTAYNPPPIPVRCHDWVACEENFDLGRPVGLGATEQEAIDDLISQLEE